MSKALLFSIVFLIIFLSFRIFFPLFSPYSFHRFHCCPIFFPFFYVKVPPFFHCFSHHFPLLSRFFPIVLCHIPSFLVPQFFHCFPIAPCRRHSSFCSLLFHNFTRHHFPLHYTWHHFTLSLFFPPFPLLSHFFSIVLCQSPSFFPLFFSSFSSPFAFFSHCSLPILSTVSIAFPFFSIVLCQSPSFFPLFFSSFSPPFPFFSHCFMSYSLIFSIICLIIFPSIAICPDPPRRADQGGIDTPTSPNCHLVHNPKKV